MTTYHMLDDASGSLQVSLHSPDERPEGESGGAEAICMIDDQQTLLVRPILGRLNTPGSLSDNGESSESTMIRAVREQASAEVTSWQLIAFARTEVMDGERAGLVRVRDMYIARVLLLPWEGSDDWIADRQIVELDDLATIMSAEWPGLDAFSAELVALARDGLTDI